MKLPDDCAIDELDRWIGRARTGAKVMTGGLLALGVTASFAGGGSGSVVELLSGLILIFGIGLPASVLAVRRVRSVGVPAHLESSRSYEVAQYFMSLGGGGLMAAAGLVALLMRGEAGNLRGATGGCLLILIGSVLVIGSILKMTLRVRPEFDLAEGAVSYLDEKGNLTTIDWSDVTAIEITADHRIGVVGSDTSFVVNIQRFGLSARGVIAAMVAASEAGGGRRVVER